jgi:hypothetical protein
LTTNENVPFAEFQDGSSMTYKQIMGLMSHEKEGLNTGSLNNGNGVRCMVGVLEGTKVAASATFNPSTSARGRLLRMGTLDRDEIMSENDSAIEARDSKTGRLNRKSHWYARFRTWNKSGKFDQGTPNPNAPQSVNGD